MNGCRINHVANTITLTKKFLQKASNPSSEECAYLQQIRTNFPHLRVTTNPAPKKKSSSRPRLSYKQMRNFINCLPDSEKWIGPFEQVVNIKKESRLHHRSGIALLNYTHLRKQGFTKVSVLFIHRFVPYQPDHTIVKREVHDILSIYNLILLTSWTAIQALR